MILPALLLSSALAAASDWKSYLCRWGPEDDAWHATQVVKVNEKDARVTIDGRDADDPKFGADSVYFHGTTRRLPVGWTIYKDGRMVASDRFMNRLIGTCKAVDDG